jgi:NarL family two-component system response regulator LiaR
MSDVTDDAPRIRALITDDDPLVRRLIRETLQADNMTVIAEAKTGREAVELALFYRPDVVVMDYNMPEMDGIEATRRIHEQDDAIRIVFLTGSDDESVAVRGLRAGAAGFLSKNMELTSLPRALRGSLDGEAAISRRLAMQLVQHYRSASTGGMGLRPVRSKLTDREWEVLDLLSGGATTDDIARQLVLSSETVRSHLKNLYRKLGVRSREAAVATAARLREFGAPV